MWVIRPLDVKDVGTDPATADNFVRNRVDLTRTGLALDEVKLLLKKKYDTKKMREATLIHDLAQAIAAGNETALIQIE